MDHIDRVNSKIGVAYNCAMDHIERRSGGAAAYVDRRFKKFYAEKREVANVFAVKMDVLSDSLSNSCSDITQADETDLDEIKVPWNHYEAILRLYTANRPEYYVVLKAAERFKKMKSEKSTEYRKHLEETCSIEHYVLRELERAQAA